MTVGGNRPINLLQTIYHAVHNGFPSEVEVANVHMRRRLTQCIMHVDRKHKHARSFCKSCKALLNFGHQGGCSPPQPGHWSDALCASSASGAASWPSWHLPWHAPPPPLPTALQPPSQHLHSLPACTYTCQTTMTDTAMQWYIRCRGRGLGWGGGGGDMSAYI